MGAKVLRIMTDNLEGEIQAGISEVVSTKSMWEDMLQDVQQDR